MDLSPITLDRVAALSTAASAIAAAIALGFNAAALRRESKARELELFDRIFASIVQLEQEFHEAAARGMVQSSIRGWRSLFLNRLEYFAFLVNKHYLQDPQLVGFFKDTIIRWHEDIFLKLGEESEKEDPKVFPELKALYVRLSKDNP